MITTLSHVVLPVSVALIFSALRQVEAVLSETRTSHHLSPRWMGVWRAVQRALRPNHASQEHSRQTVVHNPLPPPPPSSTLELTYSMRAARASLCVTNWH